MNHGYVKSSLKNLLPITLIFTLIFATGNLSGDYDTHLSNHGELNYPPLLSSVLNEMDNLIPRDLAFFFLNLVSVVVFPYFAIEKITNSSDKAWLYLYASMIPTILFFLWLVPQSIMHCLFLLGLLNLPIGAATLLIIGPFTHSAWIVVGALILIIRGADIFGIIRLHQNS